MIEEDRRGDISIEHIGRVEGRGSSSCPSQQVGA